MCEIGDPSLLLDENFELSPKNYSKLLEYTKKTAARLNEVITQSSQIFSTYLGVPDKLEHAKLEEIPCLSHCHSIQSNDSNSTRDSEHISPQCSLGAYNSPSSLNSEFKRRNRMEMTQVWESENDKILIKFATKYHKDWKKISKAFSLNYQLNYKPDFLKARHTQLIKKK